MIGATGDLLSRFPEAWKCDVTVVHGGGLDDDGRLVPETTTVVRGCLLAPQSREDAYDRSQITSGTAVLLCPPGTVIRSTDRVRTPAGSVMPGSWAVDGDPAAWPYGVEVRLTKE